MCNNNGHCRKFDVGTMCPSYRVTRDEQHLTRGRANTLRLALSGQLRDDLSGPLGTEEGLASDAVHDALDLCVSCKGCKRECPTGVDMAKLKIESLAARRDRRGLSLRDRLFTYVPRYARAASRLGWIANGRDGIPGLAALSERFLGISARRSLPRWQGDYLRGGLRGTATAPGASKEALLFVDTFTNYFAGENATAARRVLEAAGYRVHLNAVAGARPLCCGRTFLAAGLVEEAKAEARRTIDALLPFARRGVAIVGLEPSCLLGMRDEFLDYRFGEDAKLIARHALLFEEFLVREKDAGRLASRWGRSRLAKRCCMRIATRRRSPRCGRSNGARLDPRARDTDHRDELLRHGGRVRLPGRALRHLDAHGRSDAVALGTRCGAISADRR
jgi:Fe-S oxidoreductase